MVVWCYGDKVFIFQPYSRDREKNGVDFRPSEVEEAGDWNNRDWKDADSPGLASVKWLRQGQIQGRWYYRFPTSKTNENSCCWNKPYRRVVLNVSVILKGSIRIKLIETMDIISQAPVKWLTFRATLWLAESTWCYCILRMFGHGSWPAPFHSTKCFHFGVWIMEIENKKNWLKRYFDQQRRLKRSLSTYYLIAVSSSSKKCREKALCFPFQ